MSERRVELPPPSRPPHVRRPGRGPGGRTRSWHSAPRGGQRSAAGQGRRLPRPRWLTLLPLLLLLAACSVAPRLYTSADERQGAALTVRELTIGNATKSVLSWSAEVIGSDLRLRDEAGNAVSEGELGPNESVTYTLGPPSGSGDQYGARSGILRIRSTGGNRVIPFDFGELTRCQAPPQATPGEPRPVGRQVLVSYEAPVGLQGALLAATTAATRASLTAAHGLAALEVGAGSQPDLLLAPAGTDVDALIAALTADPRVRAADRNYYLELQARPSDPYYDYQWAPQSFGLEEAWAHAGAAQREVVIAIIDSGVALSHPDLAAKLLPGYDFERGSPLTEPPPVPRTASTFEKASHGTHVAGIAGALSDGVGVVGVAYDADIRLLPVKVFDDCGQGGDVNGLIKAIRWAAGLPVEGAPPNPHPADVINMSLGVTGQRALIDAAAREAAEAGVVLVAAAGNHAKGASGRATQVLSPANGPDVLGVGSVDHDELRSWFSNYGAGLDLMAPGGFGEVGADPGGLCGWTSSEQKPPSILSTVPFVPDTDPRLGYACMAGTSMASPYVAGVAALLLATDPSLSADDVRQRLLDTTKQTAATSDARQYGNGLVCADAAVGADTLCGEPRLP